MTNEDGERFSDLVYDAWRSGRNPDAVSRDRFDDLRARGYPADEIGLSDVLPKRRIATEEECPDGD